MSSGATITNAPGTETATPRPSDLGKGFAPPRLILASLSGIASLAALQALALPPWPAAAPLAAPAVLASLEKAGFEATALPPGPAQRSSELARGPRLVFQLRDGATTATLQLLPAQVRQRANFQLALISRNQPSLALPPGLPLRSNGGSVAYVIGQLGNQQLRQTCLVSPPQGVASGLGANAALGVGSQATTSGVTPTPVGGVTAAQLGAAADRGASGARMTMARILGFYPNRNYSCLLVSLGTTEVGSDPGIDRLWSKLLNSLSKS